MHGSRIPKDRIQWFPTIDYGTCLADQVCVDFCKSGVFEWDESAGQVLVVARLNCVVGCSKCAEICPSRSIHFPSQEELISRIRALRQGPGPGAA